MVRKNKVRYELIGGKPYNRQVIGIYPKRKIGMPKIMVGLHITYE